MKGVHLSAGDVRAQLLTQVTAQRLAQPRWVLRDLVAKSNADLKVANADLKVANRALGTTVTRLQRQTNVHEVLSTAVAAEGASRVLRMRCMT